RNAPAAGLTGLSLRSRRYRERDRPGISATFTSTTLPSWIKSSTTAKGSIATPRPAAAALAIPSLLPISRLRRGVICSRLNRFAQQPSAVLKIGSRNHNGFAATRDSAGRFARVSMVVEVLRPRDNDQTFLFPGVVRYPGFVYRSFDQGQIKAAVVQVFHNRLCVCRYDLNVDIGPGQRELL